MLGKHPFGLYEKALDPGGTWAPRLQKTKRLGFDFFEISVDESDARLERLYWPRTRINELKRLSDAEGVPIPSMCLSAHRKYPFGSADANTRAKARDIMQRGIDLALALGVHVIQLAGYDVYYEQSGRESVSRFVEGIAWAAELAAANQIMLGMETMDTEFMNSVTKFLKLRAAVPSPWIGVYPDIGNLTAWGLDVDAELTRGIAYIVGVHVKETLRVTSLFPGKFRDMAFGTGHVNFAGAFRTLERLGYAGPYLMEMWYRDGDDEGSIRESASFVRTCFLKGTGGF